MHGVSAGAGSVALHLAAQYVLPHLIELEAHII